MAMKKQLMEVSAVRTVGFMDAVKDLGTHMICGMAVNYSDKQVRNVLNGKAKSKRLLELIAAKRPDLFGLRYVCPEVKKFYSQYKERKVA